MKMRLFLDDIYNRRIKVLSFINNSKQTENIKDIAKATGLASRTVSMIVKQFEQELDVSEDTYKVYYMNKTIKSVYANNLDISGIGSSYLLQSVSYKIIKHIFLYEKIDVTKFCDMEFISPSTFSRYRQKLKNILQKCGLDISRENKIIGEELRIRNFYFLFFSNASNKWLFGTQEYEEMSNYFFKHLDGWKKMNSVQQSKIILTFYISTIRSSQKRFVENPTLIKLSQQRIKTKNTRLFFDYFSLKKNKTQKQVWSETSSTMFFLYKERVFDEKIEPDTYEHFFSQENFDFVKYSKLFVSEILASFFEGETNQFLYLSIRKEIDLLHLMIETCFIDTRMFYYSDNNEAFFHTDPLEKSVKDQTEYII